VKRLGCPLSDPRQFDILGANRAQIIWLVVIPILAPGIVAVVLKLIFRVGPSQLNVESAPSLRPCAKYGL
jgi:hypothetical protein